MQDISSIIDSSLTMRAVAEAVGPQFAIFLSRQTVQRKY
jgi:hypothetical protein